MSPEDLEFLVEARRHLVGLVGLIERRAGIEPSCTRCAGCRICEAMHRKTQGMAYTVRDDARLPSRRSTN